MTLQTPWLSLEGEVFPPRAPKQRRRIPRSKLASEPVVYPLPEPLAEELVDAVPEQTILKTVNESEQKLEAQPEVDQPRPSTPTPLASDGVSEEVSTQPTTPASSAAAASSRSQQTPTQTRSKPVGQVMPVVPALPQSPTTSRRGHRDSAVSVPSAVDDTATVEDSGSVVANDVQSDNKLDTEPETPAAPVVPKPKPSSWASLLRPAQSQNAPASGNETVPGTNGGPLARGEALSDVLHDMSATIDVPSKVSFLQPRGLVNTGNMCYMNSVSCIGTMCCT